MTTGHESASRRLREYEALAPLETLAARLRARTDSLPARIPNSGRVDERAIEHRWSLLKPSCRGVLCESGACGAPYAGHIENFIGEVRLPVGIAGPLRVNGLHALGDFHVPMATHEAALVASYSRGMQAISAAGGCAVWVTSEGVMRAPALAFETTAEAGLFVAWTIKQLHDLERIAATTTSHGWLNDMQVTIEGNHVYLGFEFRTGDAAGQNMVTFATQAICEHLVEHSPIKPRRWYVEGNFSGDKKASAQSYVTKRGRRATAEVVLSSALCAQRIGASPERMAEYWRMSAVGGVMSGTMGVHGHLANGLAAIYVACGQDPACVAESAVGVTRIETLDNGDLYASVTLPNLIVGTVGGGTSIPTCRACLELMDLAGSGKANALAEVCAGSVLAGELSIVGALASGEFTRAHMKLARRAGVERGGRSE